MSIACVIVAVSMLSSPDGGGVKPRPGPVDVLPGISITVFGCPCPGDCKGYDDPFSPFWEQTTEDVQELWGLFLMHPCSGDAGSLIELIACWDEYADSVEGMIRGTLDSACLGFDTDPRVIDDILKDSGFRLLRCLDGVHCKQ